MWSVASRRRPWERDIRHPGLPPIAEEAEGGGSGEATPEKRQRIIVDEAPDGALPRIVGLRAAPTPSEDIEMQAGRLKRMAQEIVDLVAAREAEGAAPWQERVEQVGIGTSSSSSGAGAAIHFLQWFADRGFGGDPAVYFRGAADMEYDTEELTAESRWVFAASRGGEVSLKSLTKEERKLFEAADCKEWAAIERSGAVRIIVPQPAAVIRQRQPERVSPPRW